MNTEMKIAFVFDNLKYGGIQRVGISYLKIFKQMGYSVDTYVLNPHVEAIFEEVKDLSDTVYVKNYSRYFCPEIYYVLVERYWWGKYAFPFIFLLLVILNNVVKLLSKRRKYDITIAFSGHPNDLNFVARGFVKAPKRCCWLHGAQYDYYIMSRGYAFLYKKIKNLIVLSNTCDVSCVKIDKLFDLTINKVYNPIKIAEKIPNKDYVFDLRSKYGDYLLFVGRLAEDKDPETIIRALYYLKKQLGIEKHLVFVGDGRKRKVLEDIVKELDLLEYVHFEGIRKDVENYYKSAFLFVHSSPLEGLPTTILESMSYGLPVVATDSMPGVREILGNNEYGIICPVGDPVSMANCIAKTYNDHQLYTSLQEKGLERLKCFDTECIKEQIVKIFNNLK
jgi:glycosyltransferase involved in cell wall biosynthesis